MLKRFKKACSLFLAAGLIATGIPGNVFASTAEINEVDGNQLGYEQNFVLPENTIDSEQLYLDKLLYGGENISTYATHEVDMLSTQQKEYYNVLKDKLALVSENGGSTLIEVSGIAFMQESVFQTGEEMQKKVSDFVFPVVRCLRQDFPEYVYWESNKMATYLDWKIGFLGDAYVLKSLTVKFAVDPMYRSNADDPYMLDTSKIQVAIDAIQNAKNIALKIKSNGQSDLEKIRTIKNKICELTNYNYDALDQNYNSSDAWQIINVFDNDPLTNVVCEGYSKAFQYIFDLVFDESPYLSCYLAYGNMNGGAHMWDVVRYNGYSYFVDVTNCDGKKEILDGLFMVAPANGLVDVVTPGQEYLVHNINPGYYPQDITYVYDERSFNLYGKEVFKLAEEHNYGEWTIVKDSTETEEGLKRATCLVCGNEIEEAIPKKEASGFTLSGSSMVLGNNLNFETYIPVDQLNGRTDVYALVNKQYADGRADAAYKIPYEEWKNSDVSNLKFVEFKGISAKEMMDKVTVQIFDNNGQALSKTYTDSIHDYALRMLKKDTSNAPLKSVLVDMLNYGAACQSYFNYDVLNPANNDIADYQQFATKNVIRVDNSDKRKEYAGTSLVTKSNIRMIMYFNELTPDMYAVVTFKNHRGKDMSFTVQGQDFDYYNGLYGVVVDSLSVADVKQMVTCEIFDGSNQRISYASDSIESYVARMSREDPVFDSIMKFGTSAYIYFHTK